MKSPYVSVVPMPDGSFRATCPLMGCLWVEAATPEEAEALLLQQVEGRRQATDSLVATPSVAVDPDVGLADEEP